MRTRRPPAPPARSGCSPASAIGFTPTGQLLNGTGVVNNQFEQTSRNYALFTHNVFSVVPDKLDVTIGVRYTNEKKTLNGTFNTNNAFCTALRSSFLQGLQGLPCVINSTSGAGLSLTDPGRVKTESEWSGTAVLSYKITPDVLTYASYSRGYKAGGFNLDTSALDPACSATFDAGNAATGLPSCAARLASAANQPGNGRAEIADLRFEPEKVNAYEVGMKWNGRGIDINIAAFYQAFRNFQLNTFNGVNFEVTNIAACKDDLAGGDRDGNFTTGACAAGRTRAGVVSKGLEFEAFAQPTPTLSTTLGVTYTDTAYRNNLTGTFGRALSPALFQLPGHRLSNSSAYTVTGSAGWTPDINDNLRGLVYVDFRYQSELNTGSDLDIEKDQPGFLTVNARIGVNQTDRKWGIELWAQNLLNTKFQQIAADAPLQGGGTFRSLQAGLVGVASANPLYITFPAEPRTYGVTVRTRF
ncbi:MAG: TonB-dependent receptor [Alphaproteobacteria bacterium]|nr:TonB-dependent receptor [Alphaproteobacteria bacterium]